MSSMLRRCLPMAVGAVALAAVLLAAGLPGAVLLGVAPAFICVGLHLVMGHDDDTVRSARTVDAK